MFWQTVKEDLLPAIFCYRLVYVNKCIIIKYFESDILFCNCACTYRVFFFLNLATFYQIKYKLFRRIISSRLGKFQVLNLCKSRRKEIKFTFQSFL